jgi:hypothetical protein
VTVSTETRPNDHHHQEKRTTTSKKPHDGFAIERGAMTENTGLFRRLETFEKLMVAANAEATVAVAYLTGKENREEFGNALETLVEESDQLRRKVARLLDAAGNENLDL